MEGSIRISQQGGQTVVTLRGLLDQELAYNLIGIANKVQPPVMLDLKQVSHVTAAGSYAILAFYQNHRQKPTVQDANTDIISLLQLSGTARYINFINNNNETANHK